MKIIRIASSSRERPRPSGRGGTPVDEGRGPKPRPDNLSLGPSGPGSFLSLVRTLFLTLGITLSLSVFTTCVITLNSQDAFAGTSQAHQSMCNRLLAPFKATLNGIKVIMSGLKNARLFPIMTPKTDSYDFSLVPNYNPETSAISSQMLIPFYLGTHADTEGRKIQDIWNYKDSALEKNHDFIQWIFPNRAPTPHNQRAPLLTDQHIYEFRKGKDRKTLRKNMLKSFDLMLDFYGFKRTITDKKVSIQKNEPRFSQRSPHWIEPYNHNLARITRILKCLKALGFEPEANAFFEALKSNLSHLEGESTQRSSSGEVISQNTFKFWSDAVLY